MCFKSFLTSLALVVASSRSFRCSAIWLSRVSTALSPALACLNVRKNDEMSGGIDEDAGEETKGDTDEGTLETTVRTGVVG